MLGDRTLEIMTLGRQMKIDGFRSLAYVENGACQLVSRNGNVFRGFKDLLEWISKGLRVETAFLDGEIACVDEYGRAGV